MNEYERRMRVMEMMDGGSIDSQADRGVEPVEINMNSQSTRVPVSETSKASEAGDVVGAGGAASVNPYLIAAGLGLKTIGAAKDREMARENQRIANEMNRREKVMQLMSQYGSGIGRIG